MIGKSSVAPRRIAYLETLRLTVAHVDSRVSGWIQTHQLAMTRWSLAVVYGGFGVLKFFPGHSPAEDLAGRTISLLTEGVVGPKLALPLLATWEVGIAVALLLGLRPKLTALLTLLHLGGTFLPFLLVPAACYQAQGPTLVGQYIAKNIVLFCVVLAVYSQPHSKAGVKNPNLN